MTPPVFRFYLKAAVGDYYFVDSTGNISLTGTPTPLPFSPIGWDDVKLSWRRSEKWWGLMRSFTTPLGFIKDSAKILRYVFAAAGIEGKAFLSIEKLQTYTLQYARMYEGEIDFSNHTDVDTQVQENIMEGGLSEILKKKENIPYIIKIDPADSTEIHNDGITLGQYEILAVNLTDAPPNHAGYPQAAQYTPKFELTYTENNLGSDTHNRPTVPGNGTTYIIPDHWWYQATAKGFAKVNVKVDMKVSLVNALHIGRGIAIKIYKVSPTGARTEYTIFEKFEYFEDVEYHIDNGVTIPVDAGDKLYFIAGVYGYRAGSHAWIWLGGNDMHWKVFSGTVSIEYPHRNKPYTVRAYGYWQVFEKLITAMSGGAFTGYSAYLLGSLPVNGNRPLLTMVTCGDAIRGLAGASLKITLADLLQDAWSRWGLTIGTVNGQARLEPLDFFFEDTPIADLGNPTDVKLTPATSFMGNSIKIGYQNQNYGELYGKDEFNATQVYALSVTRVQKELDFVSPWRADMYGIETISRNLSGKEKQDASTDNETFLIEIDYNGNRQQWEPYRPNNAMNTAGLLFPETAYNLMLSPGRSLERIGHILRSMLYPLQGNITWQVSDKNTQLNSIIGGQYFVEVYHPPLQDYSPLLFQPVWFEFEASIPDGIAAIMQGNPNGYFTFTWRGHVWKGFAWQMEIKPALHEKQTVKLLAHPSTNLTLAIR